MILEFEILSVERSEDGRCYILSGRCCKGTCAIGSTFHTACEIIIKDLSVPAILKKVAEIDLVVQKIELHQRDITWLDEGLTGSLWVTGEGAELIKPRMGIIGEC
ncbi:MAG: hypothetical protein JWO94_3946 [Verrucomicrobiaceae bacterium]|nr:hypothetical protein [Verrucomicrobiaceae bacterium]